MIWNKLKDYELIHCTRRLYRKPYKETSGNTALAGTKLFFAQCPTKGCHLSLCNVVCTISLYM